MLIHIQCYRSNSKAKQLSLIENLHNNKEQNKTRNEQFELPVDIKEIKLRIQNLQQTAANAMTKRIKYENL